MALTGSRARARGVRRVLLLGCVLLLSAGTCEIMSLSTEGLLRIRISSDPIVLAVGDTVLVSYSVLDSTYDVASARWSSRDPEIAEFVSARRLLGRSPGETVITVTVRSTDGGRGSDHARVTVHPDDQSVVAQ